MTEEERIHLRDRLRDPSQRYVIENELRHRGSYTLFYDYGERSVSAATVTPNDYRLALAQLVLLGAK